MQEFVHLHLHSIYSVLDSAGRIKDYALKAKEYGMPAIALTDHGTLSGTVEFYKTCKEVGIKPILGMESYMVKDIYDKTSTKGEERDYGHILILAKNNEGWKNLLKLSTEAYTNGFYYRPRIDFNLLQKYHKGLIVMTACSSGEISKAILRNDPKLEELVMRYKNLLGEDFYFELMWHGIPAETTINLKLIEMGDRLGIKCVATNDVHYLNKEDKEVHKVLKAIGMKKSVFDPKVEQTGDYHLAQREELAKFFRKEFLDETVKIAEKCNVELELNQISLPKVELKNTSLKDFFYNICMAQLGVQGLDKIKKYVDRLTYEIEAIDKGGFLSYFYIVRDYVQWAKNKGILVGPGRGSGCGSLVVYLLGITMVDPIKYDLKFERFINPDRKTLPDLDIDFEIDRREEVVNYIKQKYGEHNVCQIATFGMLDMKSAVKSVGKVYEYDFEEINTITKDPEFNIEKIRVKYPDIYKVAKELMQVRDEDKKVVRLGAIKHIGTHAAGIAISDRELTERVPLMKQQGKIATQYDMDSLKVLGLPKFDCLGLKNLSVIKKTIELVKQRKGKDIKLTEINFDDKDVYKMLRNGETVGVFQFESWGITKLLKDIKVDCFNDLIAANALYRPGPLRNGYTDKFADGKIRSKHDYFHPKLEPVLKDTYGVIVFQEQVMEIAQVLANLTPSQADDFREAIGKKDTGKMNNQKKAFIDGCVANGVNIKLATEIFQMLLQFTQYAFNKSHSTAYSFVAFYTAWLKYYYTLEYMTCLMNYEIGNDVELRKYVEEGKRLKIKLLPPTINESKVHFTIEGDNIRCGLLALKGVGENVAKNIISGQPYKSFDDFYERTKKVVDKGTVEVLKEKRVFRNIPMAKQGDLSGGIAETRKEMPKEIKKEITGKQEKLF